jgi:cobalt-zinc-cadmium efflux system outer membrane protein
MNKSSRDLLLLGAAIAAWLICGGCVTAPSVEELAGRVERATGGGFTLKTNANAVSLPPGIGSVEHLSEDDAVAIALWNNAAFHEALAGLGFTRADLLQAKQLRNPTLVALLPAGPKQFEFTALLPVESLWLRPRRVAVAELDLEAAAQQLAATGLNLVRDVRVACAEWDLATNRSRAAREMLRWQEESIKLTERRLQLGDATALELTQARAAALQARQALTRLERDEALARERLRALLGLANEPAALALQLADPPAAPLPSAAELCKQAFAARPELRANELVLEAARKRGQLAAAEALLVSALIDGNDTATGVQAGPGLEATVPLFHQNQAARARARTQAQQAILRHITLRDRILLEVREAAARLEQARSEWHAARTQVLPALEDAVAQARRAHELGDASPQVYLEAERRLAEARVQLAEALAETRRAEAELARAVGRRFHD